MTEDKIDSLKEAVEIANNLIAKKTQERIEHEHYINKGRHCIIRTESFTYWALFKREFFLSYGKIFNRKGCGDSINSKYLGMALNMEIDSFLYIYKNGYVYAISPKEIFNSDRQRTTKSGERTYSFDLPMHKRWR